MRRALLLLLAVAAARAQDPRELVRRSIEQDQFDWVRMKDYTWQARSVAQRLDGKGKAQSTKEEKWETLIFDGEFHRRILERDGHPLSAAEQRRQEQKLDDLARKLSAETPEEKQRRVADAEKRRKHDFEFLSEIPDLFDLKLEGDAVVDGRPVWVVSGAPRPGARAKSRDAKMLLKVRGRMWIDKATYQWAKVEAETTGVISWGLFLARLNPGARMVFEQEEVNSAIWLPKHLLLSGSGRLGLLKRLAEQDEIDWSNYRKFTVESKVLPGPPAGGARR